MFTARYVLQLRSAHAVFTARYGMTIEVILVFSAEARVRSQSSPRGICGGSSGTVRVFSSTPVSPCQYHSTKPPLSPLSIIPSKLHSPLLVSFHQCCTLPCQYHSTKAPLSPVSIIPPMVHFHLHSHADITRKDRRSKPRNLPKSNADWKMWTIWQKSSVSL